MKQLANLDFAVIGLYFFITFLVAFWCTRKNRETSADYFLAGKDVGWFIIGSSLFASNIGSEHLVGLAGTGAADDESAVLAFFDLHAGNENPATIKANITT